MLALDSDLTERTSPFQLFVGRNLLTAQQLRALSESAPTTRVEKISVEDPQHEKQYRMNLLSLIEAEVETEHVRALPAAWRVLLDDLRGEEFTTWLEQSTGIKLTGLPRSIGLYTHRNGDFLSVHKDKPTKAITAILYLNDRWPNEAGGRFQCFTTGDSNVEPTVELAPVGGQLLAFKPTDHSWHAVSEIRHPDGKDRLTMQVEYWVSTDLMGSAYHPSGR
ncbi:2OG-Fe(II) oxygenase [Streptomyces anulatus]|uniref:2OG-Fe(II) oxygenase n=1 Tax=Streptomyces anulatus TaxID=1892 RepID=UPI0034032EAF